MDPLILQTLAPLGPLGVTIWILLRREERDRQDRLEREKLDRDSRNLESVSRNTLASALTALTMRITGQPNWPGGDDAPRG